MMKSVRSRKNVPVLPMLFLKNKGQIGMQKFSFSKLLYYTIILHFTFLFSPFVFVSAAGHYFRIWTGQVPALFQIKKYNIANSSCHFGSYGSIWTGPSPKKYYMDLRSFGPYNIFLVTDRSISCHMTLSAMNYLLYSLLLRSIRLFMDLKNDIHRSLQTEVNIDF